MFKCNISNNFLTPELICEIIERKSEYPHKKSKLNCSADFPFHQILPINDEIAENVTIQIQPIFFPASNLVLPDNDPN